MHECRHLLLLRVRNRSLEHLRDPDGNIPLNGFIALRDRCPALKKILLPDAVWRDFLQWHQKCDEVAWHTSAIVLAFVRGVLPRITLPIHDYLLTGDEIAGNARLQYVKDLTEKWMFHSDP